MDNLDIQRALRVARGMEPAELVIKDGLVINVLSGYIHKENLAVDQGVFLGFGDYAGKKTISAEGKFICPALVEGHIHLESTLLNPREFARVAAQHGTAVVVCDPHEIANVYGAEGIEFFLHLTADLPVEIYLMAPSCVPSSNLETSGARLDAQELNRMMRKYPRRILGLGELMNFPGVIAGDTGLLSKIKNAQDKIIDGHCPGLRNMDLNAYILAGPASDHESISQEEAAEKLSKGMHIMIRQGTSEKNLLDIQKLSNEYNSQNFSLVTDDRLPDELYSKGHMDYNIQLATEQGLDPLRALQMSSVHTARYFGLKKRGAIAPGYRADFIILDNLSPFHINRVYLAGEALQDKDFEAYPNQFHISREFKLGSLDRGRFQIPAKSEFIRAIQIVPGQIVTKEYKAKPFVDKGYVLADPEQDLAKLAVLERYGLNGNIALGLVKGLGLRKGAIGSSVAHDAHNLIVAGCSDKDMIRCARELEKCGGGFIAVLDDNILAELPLPIGGLMSDRPISEVMETLKNINSSVRALGPCIENIFMVISFLALPVIPKLRLTDRGLVDVEAFEFTSLWLE